MNETKNVVESRSDSPPPLSSLSIKAPQKSLGLQLTPTVTTSPATPSREQAVSGLKSPLKSPKSPSDDSKPSPLRSPPKLATLSKPSNQSFLSTAFRNRNARHSIDVKVLPSYLAKKRQSTFGQFLTGIHRNVLNPSAPDASSSSDEPLFEEPIAPTLSLGERVAWVQTSGPEFGSVRWIGRMPQITNDWTVGVEFDNCIGSGDGTVEGRRYFVAKENFAKFLPLSTLTKVDNYAGRPRSGTMLSRMSVQLKPGQLISIQRSPSVVQQHCSLNAPHHVGHDVHETNEKHCQCGSCNHPCAHICKTSKPKGRRRWQDPGLAHMCHFSSKPHNKMCCGGEDLACANRPLTAPGTSWMPINDFPSLRTVPTGPIGPIPRRKSVTIHDDRKAISAPTSVERTAERNPEAKPEPSPLPSTLKERRGSDLSISSLPSSGSPQVYIARGVLTDESDFDSETDRSYSPINRFRGHTGMAGMARAFVHCFTNNSSSLREKKKIKEKRKRKLRKQKKRSKTDSRSRECSERRHRRGLSSDTSYDYETTHNSQNQTSSIVSNISSSKLHTNVSPVQHRSTSMSPKQTTIHSPKEDKNALKEEYISGAIIEEEVNRDVVRHRVDEDTISEGNEGQDGCTSSSKSSGHLITTKADIESTPITNRSLSSHSTLSDSLSPRRRKKTAPAPPPPPTASTSASPTSLNLSVSSTSLPQTPTHSSTPASVSKRRTSYKKNPAPTPPNLTRSLSEQKQLNVKNMINAVPSFRSEVDLQGASRKSSPFGDSIERDGMSLSLNSNDNRDEMPLNRSDSKERISKSDASTQVVFENDYYEEICFAPKDNDRSDECIEEKPVLPKKTFDAISTFGCEVNKVNNSLTDCNQTSISICKSNSMPLNKKRNTTLKGVKTCDQRYSTDLNALLSPQHKPHILGLNAESLLRGLSDGSVNSTATVIEFINALNDLDSDKDMTVAQHSKPSVIKISDSLVDISSDNTSDERITVKSMPTKWRYSSSSVDSLSDSIRSSKTSESTLLPNHRNKLKNSSNNANNGNNHWSQLTGGGFRSSASEQSLSSMSSSSTLSYASTIGSSSSTPTPIVVQKPYKDLKSGKPPKHPTHPLPKPRSKNRNPNNTGNVEKESETNTNERSNNSSNDRNMFKNSGQSMLNIENSNTLVVDETRVAQIMEQLEVAIAYGQHKRAAVLAKELAIRKVTCTLNRSGLPNNNSTAPIIAYLYIEDRMAHRGPIPFQVYPSMSLNMLKLKVEKEFNIPSEMQKWILGKTLATNLNASLATYGITCSGCPIFLYLLTETIPKHSENDKLFENQTIPQNNEWLPNDSPELEPHLDQRIKNLEQTEPESDLRPETSDEINELELLPENNVIPEEVEKEKPTTYIELVELDDINCVSNTQPFECPVCFLDIGVGEGIVLRDCLHVFCRYCLLNAIQYNEEVEVKCPFRNDDYSCDSRMQDREVKGVVPLDLYERYLQKSISTAESKTEKSFHCKTIDCRGWCEFDDNVNVFLCQVCGHENCLNCSAIHENMNCKQYQDQLEFNAAQSEDAMKTKKFIDDMLKNDEALRCPQCQVVLLKKWGCDWVKCSMCETEICWVTKGFRWGPKGRGDTSAGCKCNVRGKKCHPNCKYCH